VKRLLRDLGDVRSRAGRVRDMDVLTAHALTVKQPGEQDCLVQLIEYLGAERRQYARKLRSEIQETGPQLRRRLDRNLKRVEKALKKAEDNPADSDAIPVTLAKAIKLSSELNKPPRLARSTLHAYRLKVKELRNVLQLSDHTADQEFLRKLAEVKDGIGEWHDWEELKTIATRQLAHGSSCKLIKHLKKTADSKYKLALALANQLRSDYLRPRKLGHGTNTKGAEVSPAIVEATSAIAGD
jgi:CHAD domain-containing protein